MTEKARHRIKHEHSDLFKVPIIKNFLLKNAQFNFSSRFPRDVIDNALMNSSNSIEPSCYCPLMFSKEKRGRQEKEKDVV